jgi:hypothetical protein
MDAADDNVVTSQHRREIIDAIGIAFLGGHAIEPRHLARVTHDCRDVMAAPRELGQDTRPGIACRTDQGNLHYFLPPMSCSRFLQPRSRSLATLGSPLETAVNRRACVGNGPNDRPICTKCQL